MESSSTDQDEYARIAPFYDAILGPFLTPLRKDVLRIVKAWRFRKILDLCCGTGEQCIMLHGAGLEASGVDLSPAMLRVAARRSPADIRYYLEDASQLHFTNGAFDCVIISFALHEKDPDLRKRILQESLRVLTEEGRLLIIDYAMPRGFLSGTAMAPIDLVERLAGRAHHDHFRDFMKRGALEGLLEEQGLVWRSEGMRLMGTVRILIAARTGKESNESYDP